jgi:hypothetical protein
MIERVAQLRLKLPDPLQLLHLRQKRLLVQRFGLRQQRVMTPEEGESVLRKTLDVESLIAGSSQEDVAPRRVTRSRSHRSAEAVRIGLGAAHTDDREGVTPPRDENIGDLRCKEISKTPERDGITRSSPEQNPPRELNGTRIIHADTVV